jgi:hypothetical protein
MAGALALALDKADARKDADIVRYVRLSQRLVIEQLEQDSTSAGASAAHTRPDAGNVLDLDNEYVWSGQANPDKLSLSIPAGKAGWYVAPGQVITSSELAANKRIARASKADQGAINALETRKYVWSACSAKWAIWTNGEQAHTLTLTPALYKRVNATGEKRKASISLLVNAGLRVNILTI